ncbi:MAG TPA: CDP-glucose 4,6-dehydratase, partial [Deltaproteobacteria bacterium]|nr:CDP-glucose 4,6-dehydratase [Deltaproteobacteria bacterium]
EPFNFGPHSEDVATVGEVVERFSASLEGLKFNIVDQRLGGSFHEAGLLKLSCDKAQHKLDWLPVLTLDEALERTSRWYQKFYTESGEVRSFSGSQIDEYCKLAKERGRVWAN